MRRYFAWALGAMALFSSCKMYDNLPEGDDKPALYLTKEMGKLTDLLTGNASGWRLVLLPGSYQYGGINIAFKFHKGGAVESYSEDLDEVIHSSYRIYNTAGIRLTFGYAQSCSGSLRRASQYAPSGAGGGTSSLPLGM